MNNIDNTFNYIFVAVFFAISLWGTYVLTKSNKNDDKHKNNLKCSK